MTDAPAEDVFLTYRFQYGSQSMTEDEAWALLEAPETKTLILSTVDESSIPQATPVFFHVHERKVYFSVIKDPPKKKIRNIAVNPHVCLTVDRIDPDGRAYWVSILGVAKIVASEGSADPREQAIAQEFRRRVQEKYRVHRAKPRWDPKWKQVWEDVLEHTYVEVTPVKIFSYDSGKRTPELFEELTGAQR